MCKECDQNNSESQLLAIGPGVVGMAEAQARSTAERIIESMGTVPEKLVPEKKEEKRNFRARFIKVVKGKCLRFYVGSCPDYSHDGAKYTHECLGDGVPLLTRNHLEVNMELLRVLEREGIECEMVVMVADVEAVDEIFCDRFTSGDQAEFLARCDRSVRATQGVLPDGRIRSTSFFGELGSDRFLDLQGRYSAVLADRFERDGIFHNRVVTDTMKRADLYAKMYPQVFNNGMTMGQRYEFLMERTIRTMAQYLTLGRLIGGVEDPVAIINHPTTNVNMYNSRGKFLLPEDDHRYPHPTVPILTMTRR